VGVDATIQLSCATMLARLGYTYSSLTEEGPHLMKARACNVVIDFLTRFYSGAGHRPKGFLSFDHNKRVLRLQLAVGTSENEDFIATTLFSGQVLQQRLHWEGYHASQATQLKLKAAEDRVTELERHIKKLTAQNRSQAIVVKRELSRIKENTSHDSKQLVAIHAAERSMAENQVVECHLTAMRDELRHALANTLEAENHNKELSRQIEQERVRSNQLKEVIDSLNEKLDSQSRTKQELEDELFARGKTVEEFETTNDRLRDDLEELFADMVSLSIVYESKESEVIAMNRNHHDELEAAHRDLRREKARSKDLQKMHDDLQESNEKLRRKLEKYKQRLQDEQRDREEENVRRKRNGPVSYMNHLHQSTSLDRSRDRSTIKESGSNLPSTSRLRLEKENSYSYTLPRR
jgi:chromosome segregation ATPase